jgi:uncharacterized protein (DUF305 family)
MMKLLVPLAALVALAISACSGGDHSSTADHGAEPTYAPAGIPADATFNQADVEFVQGMIPHHQQAVEMAELALKQTTNPRVVELAEQIKAAQDPEIQTMRQWLQTWGQPESMATEGHGGMSGMMSEGEMAELAHHTGTDFDRMFLEMMVRHHNGAITMAQAVKREGKSTETLALADAIIAAQQAEIATMESWLAQGDFESALSARTALVE